ncbi:carboxypeptidase regulatory-like domain-containing protein [Jiangella asiatica]|uniref:Carboxypeptidase regulatory-like domain-containing protein n=1 Tax=Jiangella asiatica TaxID=2530372 RepID=A0A4R5CLH4_9ACTN|nr:carboxypeptidase regulatory-like domain-containing protein [Jiangella asiatica]TDE00107.1 carboxypeptidase regulatory-like domain-containing protein [Jiangella asiatica]
MPDDEQLLDRLREVLEATDPPPPALVDAAKASLAWRTVDAELAELVADSTTELAAAVRAADPPRLLTFTAGETIVVLEVVGDADARRVMGQILAPAPAAVEVRHAAGALSVDADADGRFRAAAVPAGPISVTCRFPDGARPTVVTSWVTI